MTTETQTSTAESREANTSGSDGIVGIDFLSTIPEFASEKTETPNQPETSVTKTETEIAAENEAKLAEETKLLADKAKEFGLGEGATKEQVAEAEKKFADELKTKATELGLPETATKQEIEAKEAEVKAASEQEGFVSQSELETGILGAEDGTWKALALAKGYEVPEDFADDFEAFNALDNANWEKKIQEAELRGEEKAFANLKPEVRAALELANQIPDLTLEQVLSPTIQIDNYLKLDKETLIKEEIKASNPEYTEEMVELEIQRIKDAKQDDILDQKIRLDLNKQRENLQNLHKQRIQEYQDKVNQTKIAAEKAKIDQVNKALDRDLTFLDKKVTDIDRQFLRKRIGEGALDQLINNPEKLARALMIDEFYDKGVKSYENRVREKVMVEHKNQIHNIPKTTGMNQNVVVTKKPDNNINDILKADFGS